MMKDRFIQLYQSFVKRPGADKLLAWLETTDFFEAPASTRFHLSCPGGLVEHSIHVYHRLHDLYVSERQRAEDQPFIELLNGEEETIAI